MQVLCSLGRPQNKNPKMKICQFGWLRGEKQPRERPREWQLALKLTGQLLMGPPHTHTHICCSCFPAQCPPLFRKMSWAPPLSGILFTPTSTTEYLTVQQIKWQMMRFVEKSSAVHSLKYYTNVFLWKFVICMWLFSFIIYFLVRYLHAYSLLYKISYAN